MNLENQYRQSPAKAQHDEQELRRLSRAAAAFTKTLLEEIDTREDTAASTAMLYITLQENADDLHHHLSQAIAQRGTEREVDMMAYYVAQAADAWTRFAYIIGNQSRLDQLILPWEVACSRCGLRKESREHENCATCTQRISRERIVGRNEVKAS